MPVFETTYKGWDGDRRSVWWRMLTFPHFTFMQISGKKIVQAVFVSGWLPFFMFLLYIYLHVNTRLMAFMNIPENAFPPVTDEFFFAFLVCQIPFLFAFTLIVGPGLISTDIRHQALPMILSKPINRWEYLLGKFMVLFIFLSALSWFQGLILFIAQTSAADSASEWSINFWRENLWILPKFILFALILIITLNLMIMMFSSLTHNARFASVALVMFVIGSSIVAPITSAIFKTNKWMALSSIHLFVNLGQFLLGNRLKMDFSPTVAWTVLFLLWVGCIAILSNRVKAFQMHHE